MVGRLLDGVEPGDHVELVTAVGRRHPGLEDAGGDQLVGQVRRQVAERLALPPPAIGRPADLADRRHQRLHASDDRARVARSIARSADRSSAARDGAGEGLGSATMPAS